MSGGTVFSMGKHVRARKQYRRTFLREWRQFREMTQEEAAEAIGIMDRSNLARHELGHYPYSQDLLEAAARVYQCEPWDILNVNPLNTQPEAAPAAGVPREFIRVFEEATPEEIAELLGYARGMVNHRNRNS